MGSVVVFLAVCGEVVGPVLLKADVVVCTRGVRCKDAIVRIGVFKVELKMVSVFSFGAVTSVVGIVVALGTVESVSVCCGINIVVVFKYFYSFLEFSKRMLTFFLLDQWWVFFAFVVCCAFNLVVGKTANIKLRQRTLYHFKLCV